MDEARLKDWFAKQSLMEADYGVSDYRLKVWDAEQKYVDLMGRGFTLNLGAGDSPIKADVKVDPLAMLDVVCVGEYLPFRKVFDTIIVFSVLDHVVDDFTVLMSALKVLRKGGRILIMNGVLGWVDIVQRLRTILLHRRILKDPYHFRHYWFDFSIKRLFEETGLELVDYRVERPAGGSSVCFATLEDTDY